MIRPSSAARPRLSPCSPRPGVIPPLKIRSPRASYSSTCPEVATPNRRASSPSGSRRTVRSGRFARAARSSDGQPARPVPTAADKPPHGPRPDRRSDPGPSPAPPGWPGSTGSADGGRSGASAGGRRAAARSRPAIAPAPPGIARPRRIGRHQEHPDGDHKPPGRQQAGGITAIHAQSRHPSSLGRPIPWRRAKAVQNNSRTWPASETPAAPRNPRDRRPGREDGPMKPWVENEPRWPTTRLLSADRVC